ncbi:hypothetical protein ACWNYQ_00505 [Candidatus Vidania fulgoroideorum]
MKYLFIFIKRELIFYKNKKYYKLKKIKNLLNIIKKKIIYCKKIFLFYKNLDHRYNSIVSYINLKVIFYKKKFYLVNILNIC